MFKLFSHNGDQVRSTSLMDPNVLPYYEWNLKTRRYSPGEGR